MTRNPLISDGMALSFFAPSILNDIARAVVDKAKVANLKFKWQFSCVMFIVGFKPTLATFTTFIEDKWPFLDNLSAILQ